MHIIRCSVQTFGSKVLLSFQKKGLSIQFLVYERLYLDNPIHQVQWSTAQLEVSGVLLMASSSLILVQTKIKYLLYKLPIPVHQCLGPVATSIVHKVAVKMLYM